MEVLQAYRVTATAALVLNLKHHAVYLKNSAVKLLNVPTQVIVLYYLWSVLLADGAGAITPARMLGYYSMAFLVRWLFSFRSVTERYEKAIHEGDLVNALVRPLPFAALELGRVGAQWAVNMALMLVLFFPVTLLAGWVEPTIRSVVGFMLLLAVGVLVQYFIYSLIGLASFWLGKVFGLVYAFDLVMLLGTGTLLPLDMYPGSVARILQALPFRFFVYTPVRALQEQVTWGWIGAEVASGVLWMLLLGVLTVGVWRRGMRRFTGQGV